MERVVRVVPGQDLLDEHRRRADVRENVAVMPSAGHRDIEQPPLFGTGVGLFVREHELQQWVVFDLGRPAPPPLIDIQHDDKVGLLALAAVGRVIATRHAGKAARVLVEMGRTGVVVPTNEVDQGTRHGPALDVFEAVLDGRGVGLVFVLHECDGWQW